MGVFGLVLPMPPETDYFIILMLLQNKALTSYVLSFSKNTLMYDCSLIIKKTQVEITALQDEPAMLLVDYLFFFWSQAKIES